MREPQDQPVASFLALSTVLLRGRWRVVRWMLAGAVLAAARAFILPARYEATAAFVPQATNDTRSGLATLAGQFGVSIPTTNASESPDFYVRLVKSRELLGRIAADTFTVVEEGGRLATLDGLFDTGGATPAVRHERAEQRLERVVNAAIAKNAGVVELSAATGWPSVSLAIVRHLVDDVNEFNQRTRQTQASAERKFLESRIAVARSELRAAEDSLQRNLAENRELIGASALTFVRERLQRAVSLRQQLYTALMESYDDVRLREVRDTPVISVVEAPAVSPEPESRGRVLGVLVGVMLGGLAGAGLVIGAAAMRRRREEGGVEVEQFIGTVGEVKSELSLSRRPWRRHTNGGRTA